MKKEYVSPSQCSNENVYPMTLLWPAGNTTALVKGLVPKFEKEKINKLILRQFPSVEQVGFYDVNQNGQGCLEMAGGEFCGNATRALAYLLLNGKKGVIQITASGTKQVLLAGVNKERTSFAQMPILQSFSSVTSLTDAIIKVTIDGITHLIVQKRKVGTRLTLKIKGYQLLRDFNLLTNPAAGVMFVSTDTDNNFIVDPIVWVRDIQTLFYETACASGSTAIGLWQSLQQNKDLCTLRIKQPSNELLTIKVRKTKRYFKQAVIEGPINIIGERRILCQEK